MMVLARGTSGQPSPSRYSLLDAPKAYPPVCHHRQGKGPQQEKRNNVVPYLSLIRRHTQTHKT
jgi:hypothetical protein